MMSTKACNITEDEVWALMQYHARQICNSGPNYDAPIDRLNYLQKRLEAFTKPEVTPITPPNPENKGSSW